MLGIFLMGFVAVACGIAIAAVAILCELLRGPGQQIPIVRTGPRMQTFAIDSESYAA
jgi:hypothetical protein